MRVLRKIPPSVDSQTVQNSSVSEQSGYDAGKKKKGIKRQIATDKIGCLLANQHYTKIGIWVVERTFAWLNNSRRLSKNYEYSMSSAETMVKISHLHTLLNRL